ncbi:hypothetical protein [Undibacterium sp.]|uniref:hypothetical protein n=1 Tax=Undibacterium sp. TaxID=1914977 RepID=UPI00374C8B39
MLSAFHQTFFFPTASFYADPDSSDTLLTGVSAQDKLPKNCLAEIFVCASVPQKRISDRNLGRLTKAAVTCYANMIDIMFETPILRQQARWEEFWP